MSEQKPLPAWAEKAAKDALALDLLVLPATVDRVARALADAARKERKAVHRDYAYWLRHKASREHLKPAAFAALDDVAVVAEANAERGEWSSSVPMSDAIAARGSDV